MFNSKFIKMKKILLFSILTLSVSMASCTQDSLGTDTEIQGPQADDTGGNGNVPIKPPPPPCPGCPG